MANKKISELTAKGTAIAATDLLEISESDGAGGASRDDGGVQTLGLSVLVLVSLAREVLIVFFSFTICLYLLRG